MNALELVSTEQERQLSATVPELVVGAQSLVIWDEDSANVGADIAKLISEALKVGEEERKKIVKPINDSVKLINNRFKKISDPLEQALAVVKGKILEFRRAQEKIRLAQAEAARLAAEKTEAPVVTAPVAVATKGQLGTAYTRKSWKYRVKDISKVRLDLLCVNDAAVKALIAQGVREEPGIEFYEEESVGIR